MGAIDNDIKWAFARMILAFGLLVLWAIVLSMLILSLISAKLATGFFGMVVFAFVLVILHVDGGFIMRYRFYRYRAGRFVSWWKAVTREW